MAAALGGGALFAAVAAWVHASDGAPAADRALFLALRDGADPARPLGPAWLAEASRDATALGSVTVLALFALAAALHLRLTRGRRPAAALLGLILAGGALSFGLKALAGRPRPDLVPHAARVFTESFPSGHAMLAAVVWLTLAGALAEEHPRPAAARALLAVAGALTLLAGVTRVHLGVHWPSDVAAGWGAGGAWAALSWLALRALRRRGAFPPRPPRVRRRPR